MRKEANSSVGIACGTPERVLDMGPIQTKGKVHNW